MVLKPHLVIVALVGFLAPALASEPIAPNTLSSQSTNTAEYSVKGVVLEVNPAEKSVKIKHDEIPGYMAAMTMSFDVKDTNELNGIEAGDPVAFRMLVTDTYGWIDHIKKTGPKQNVLPTTGHFRFVRDVQLLNPGDLLPDYKLTNQLGEVISTKQFKGQALAISFLFTRCPFPTFCPLTARRLAETQDKLLQRSNAPTNWQLLTISFDPEFDTPSVLKAFGENYGYNPAHWTFATGALTDVTAIGEQLGLTFWRDETGSFSHNLRTVVFDATGRVQKGLIGNDWTSDELATELIKAAAK
jgi:protein SCO1/2